MEKKWQLLSGAQLKWIAMASMLIDHFNKGIVYSLTIVKGYSPDWLVAASYVMDVLGRIAFPIFLFLLVEGFLHTRSRGKYFIYLFAFGLLSEVPYDMFESGEYVDWGGQNMFFTLALALLVIWASDYAGKRLESRGAFIAAVTGITAAGACASALAGFDYTYYGIIIPVIFYLLRDRRIGASVLAYICIIKELWSAIGFVLINLYSGERGRFPKWFGYVFYPVHLLIIGAVRMYVLNV